MSDGKDSLKKCEAVTPDNKWRITFYGDIETFRISELDRLKIEYPKYVEYDGYIFKVHPNYAPVKAIIGKWEKVECKGLNKNDNA